MERQRKPWIGFVGILIILAGVLSWFSSASLTTSCVVLTVGIIILVYALMSGHIKFLG